MATITFDKTNKHILLGTSDINVSVQELADAIRTYEALLNNFDLKRMMTATGKDNVGAGVTTSITLTLEDGWKLNAQARGSPTVVTIFGGNFISDDGSSPFFPVTNVTYDRAQSTSGSLLQDQTIENIQQAVENQNYSQGAGDVFYWDPINGDDLADGKSFSTAVLTFAQAHTLCTFGAGDVIYIRSATSVTITENITISKNNVHLRGLGVHTKFKPTTGVPITVTGSFCEVKGVEINFVNHDATPNYGIDNLNGNGFVLKNCRFIDTNDVAVYYVGNNANLIENCFIIRSGGAGGICLADTKDTLIKDTNIVDSTNDGLYIIANTNGASDHNVLDNVKAVNCGGYGVDIVNSNVSDFIIGENCQLQGNSLGRINDNGTNTWDGEVLFRQVAVYNDIGHSAGGRSLDR